ncbi:MAG: zf-HC2 domain-containing protein, partial [Candidatus Aminicenantes bacterium]|nr:zf-HC2 domain-containing protein [Candidatus Aminicenantes bacterium]
MNCRHVQKWLPLFVGGDLDPAKTAVVERHLKTCAGCREERARDQESLFMAKRWLGGDRVVWSETDWRRVVRRAVDRPAERTVTSSLAPWPYKKSLAWVLMAASFLVLVFLFIRPSGLSRLTGLESARLAEMRREPLWAPEKKPGQDVVSMTMVTPDSGITIVWFMN